MFIEVIVSSVEIAAVPSLSQDLLHGGRVMEGGGGGRRETEEGGREGRKGRRKEGGM